MRSQRAKQWKLSTQTCPRISKVAHGRVLVSQNNAESYRGQSSWLVVLRGQSFFVKGVYILWWLCTRMAGENRGQCLDKCMGVGRIRVGGHETRPKPKPNVDYYLVTYYYYYY